MARPATKARKKPAKSAGRKPPALPVVSVVSDFEAEMALTAGPAVINREKFCQAFVRTGSVLDAIKEVAPTVTNKATALKLAKSYTQDPAVAARIRVIAADIIAQEQATTAVVWGNTMRMATTCISELVRDDWTLKPVNEIAPGARTAIKKLKVEERFEPAGDGEPTRIVTTTLEIHDRLAATRLLATLHKMTGTGSDKDGEKQTVKDAIREMQAEFQQGQERVEAARRQRLAAEAGQ